MRNLICLFIVLVSTLAADAQRATAAQGDQLHHAGVLFMKMSRLYYAGKIQEAIPWAEEGLTYCKKTFGPKHTQTAAALHNLAVLLAEMGDYAAARPLQEEALEIRLRTLGERNADTAFSLLDLGMLLQDMGDYETARSYLERGLAVRKRIFAENNHHIAVAHTDLADLLLAVQDYDAAQQHYERAVEILMKSRGGKEADTARAIHGLGAVYYSRGDYARAKPYLERALRIREAGIGLDNPHAATSLTTLGRLHQAEREYATAGQYLQQALATNKDALGDDHPRTAASYDDLSRLHAEMVQWEEAVGHMDQARRIVRRHVARVLPSLTAKEQARFLSVCDEDSFHGALSMGGHRAADPRIVSLSAGWLLNGKAVASEATAQRSLLARQSDDPKVGEAVKEVLKVRRQLAGLTFYQPNPGQEATRLERLQELENQEERLAHQIADACGQEYRLDPWIEVADLRDALPSDGLFVDVARFRGFDFVARKQDEQWQQARYVAWVIPTTNSPQSMKIVDLGEAETIDRAAQEVRMRLQGAMGSGGSIAQQGEPEAEKELRDLLRRLAVLVLDPITREGANSKRLIVSPDGALWLVPWGALPLADGRYAIEQYQIRYVVSGRDLVTQQTARLQTGRPMIMADPNYDLSPTETQAATRAVLRGAEVAGSDQLRSLGPMTSSSALLKAARLPYTAAEAQLISPQLESYAGQAPILYTDRYALEGVFKAFQRPRVAVLSTHGFFLEDQVAKHDDRLLASTETRGVALTVDGKPIENPLLRCGLLLAGCNQSGQARSAGGEDGVLTGMEIVGTDLRGTELVVLSACETGLGQVRNGEGVAGLRQAFQLAGAKAVVATLWQIPDRESARLMTTFFENLAAGQTKADALRNAQLKMIEYRREKYGAAHPFYWAAFTITGE